MFSHKFNESVSKKTYFDWFLLAFLAGDINAGGFLACNRFVSHVTGFATLAGVATLSTRLLEVVGYLSILGFFLGGVMISGYFTEKDFANRVHGQRYAPVMGIATVILALVSVLGTLGWFGVFGEPVNLKHDFVLLALLSGACGLQNAAITSASGATVRTTHLTGLTTDLGLGLVRAEIHPHSKEQQRSERISNILRSCTILAFFAGSAVGAFFYSVFEYGGFLLPTFIALYASWVARSGETATTAKSPSKQAG